MRLLRIIILLVLILPITACQHQPISQMVKRDRAYYLAKMQYWEASGRIAITGPEQINASFHWRQSEDNFYISFYSPYSSDSIIIEGNSQNYKIQSKSHEDKELINLDYDLPFHALSYWLRGMSIPNTPTQEIKFDEHKQLSRLKQENWSVDYEEYQSLKPISLPKKLKLTDNSVQAKILIKSWLK